MPSDIYHCYSVDASIMIKFKDMLPQDLFKPAWDEIDRLVAEDRWKIYEDAAEECGGETLKNWVRDNDKAIVKFNPEINDYINRFMAESQNNNMMLIDPMSLKNNADPFVVMLALYIEQRDLRDLRIKRSDDSCCVLTNEEFKQGKINIPAVCNYYHIPHMNLFKFMRHHGWQISLEVHNP